jgi:hypothetical protein
LALEPIRRVDCTATERVAVGQRDVAGVVNGLATAVRATVDQSPPSTPVTIGPSTSCTTINLRRASDEPVVPVTCRIDPLARHDFNGFDRPSRRTAEVSACSNICFLHLGYNGSPNRPAPDRGFDYVGGKTEASLGLPRKSSTNGPHRVLSGEPQCV